MRTRLDLLVIVALALYRAWRFVAKDKITERWREEAFNRWPPSAERAAGRMKWSADQRQMVYSIRPESNRDQRPKVSWIAASIACPWCAPLILALPLTLVVDACFGLTWPLAWWLALSASVGLLGRAEG